MGINVNYSDSGGNFIFNLPNIKKTKAIKSYTPEQANSEMVGKIVKLTILNKEVFLNKADLDKWLAHYEGNEKVGASSVEDRIKKIFQDFKYYVPAGNVIEENSKMHTVAIIDPLDDLLLKHLPYEERLDFRLSEEFDYNKLETDVSYKRKVADGYIIDPPEFIKKKLE